MKSLITHLELLYPEAKWFDKVQIKRAYRSFLTEQLDLISQNKGRKPKPLGLIEKKVVCAFHKWNQKVIKTTMVTNHDGLATIYLDRKSDHIHAKFLKEP